MARLGRALFQLSCVRLQGELHKFMRCSSEAEHEYKKKKEANTAPLSPTRSEGAGCNTKRLIDLFTSSADVDQPTQSNWLATLSQWAWQAVS